MTNNLKYLFVVLFVVEYLCSCSPANIPQNNAYIIWKNKFKGSKTVLSDELKSIIPFTLKENTKPLNLPITLKVGYYNFGKRIFNEKKQTYKLSTLNKKLEFEQNKAEKSFHKIQVYEKKIERKQESLTEKTGWFWRNIGEKTVYLNVPQVENTCQEMRKYLFDKGFRDAQVKYRIDTIGQTQKVNVEYLISENQPYLIDSIFYKIKDGEIAKILNDHKSEYLIQKGNLFDLSLIEAEKLRIEQLLKSNGYYLFISKYINAQATNESGNEAVFKKEKKGILQFEILNPENETQHEQFTVDQVIFKAFDPNSVISKNKIADTVLFKNIRFLRIDKNLPLGLLRSRILSKPNKLFNARDIYETQKQIGMLNQFSFASSQIDILKPNHLAIQYFAPILEKYTLGISPGINNIYDNGYSFFGFGIPITFTARNLFNKLETIESSIRASYEGQPTPLNTAGTTIKGSKELGYNLNVTLPSFWDNNHKLAKLNLKNPRTIISTSLNYSEPFWGKRINFKFKVNYSIQLSRFSYLYIAPIDASLVNTTYFTNKAGNDFYNALVALQQQGNNLKVTYDPQFVSSINANYVYNNQNPSKSFASSKFFRLFVESGGNLLNFASNKDKIFLIEKLFPLKQSSQDSLRAYFRFVKINADYRKNINISKNSSVAYRFNIGVTNPYGKNRSLPYDKNFFIGGSNSIRAWAPRTLGTGSAKPDTTSSGNTIPQPGDIILESSLEYRLKVARAFGGNIQIATFIDAGNIWKWYGNAAIVNDPAQFKFNRFFKEFALGTGFGLRYDLSYFLLRFDWGIKVMDPSRPIGNRFVLDEFTLRRHQLYGLNWNFGIGYPF